MQTRRFADRTVAHKWAARERPTKADRVVMACEQCPATRPSKRRPPRWALVARNLAARFSALRTALVSELAAERERRLACGTSMNPEGA